ncbi:MAG: zf-HC2 domain-containing protein [Gemmatimonadales bacterium]
MTESLHSEWTDLLSEYLDEELDPATRQRVDDHLAGCSACRDVLADLEQIVVAAPHYRGTAPAQDLWAGIADAIEANRVRALPAAPRWLGSTARRLLAAGVTLAVLGGSGGYWLAQRGASILAAPDSVEQATGQATGQVIPAGFDSEAYDRAVGELEEVLVANRHRLDTATVRVVEESLRTIDAAIADARLAIQRDSANAYLNGQIAAHLWKKVTVLRLAARALGSET